jgi:hypothetical protein
MYNIEFDGISTFDDKCKAMSNIRGQLELNYFGKKNFFHFSNNIFSITRIDDAILLTGAIESTHVDIRITLKCEVNLENLE